jgi:hypothetical protein
MAVQSSLLDQALELEHQVPPLSRELENHPSCGQVLELDPSLQELEDYLPLQLQGHRQPFLSFPPLQLQGLGHLSASPPSQQLELELALAVAQRLPELELDLVAVSDLVEKLEVDLQDLRQVLLVVAAGEVLAQTTSGQELALPLFHTLTPCISRLPQHIRK